MTIENKIWIDEDYDNLKHQIFGHKLKALCLEYNARCEEIN